MYKLKISSYHDNWYTIHEFSTKDACFNYLEQHYDLEEPDSPWHFEIIDSDGNTEIL